MKTKLITCISAVFLTLAVACQTAPPPKPLEPVDNRQLPDKCPVLHLQQTLPSRCCYMACKEQRYPGAAYQRCKNSVLSNYNCSTDQYIVIGFSNFNDNCRCN